MDDPESMFQMEEAACAKTPGARVSDKLKNQQDGWGGSN